MRRLLHKKHGKKYFYFLCFLTLCICDQRIGSAGGETQLVCPNIVLMVLSCLALSHYPLSDFRRRRFWIPAIVCMAGAGLALGLMWPKVYYHYQLLSGVIAAVLYGCVLIQTAHAIFSAKKLPRGSHPGLGLLGMLLVWSLLSHYDKYNGFLLCLSVVLMYLTDFTDREYDWMLKSLGGAVLTAFFVFQGLAFVFRPYDTLRYLGLYANTNINALFYQMVYCVFLGFFCALELKKEHCLLKWGSFCFACAMWSFVLLTMCRSAIAGMAAATVLGFGITLWKRRGRRLLRGLICVCGLPIGIVAGFPVVYGAVRYLPAVFHHPVWFTDEYSEEKVHSWDPYDSEKYTDWREVLQGNFGRFFPETAGAKSSMGPDWGVFSAPAGQQEETSFVSDGVPVILLASGGDVALPAGTVSEDVALPAGTASWDGALSAGTVSGDVALPVGTASWDVALPGGMVSRDVALPAGTVSGEDTAPQDALSEEGNSIDFRLTIYRHYLSQLNLWGHADSENGIQVNADYRAPHAHNIFLQYAFNYGLPAGILLLAYLAASGIRFLVLCIRNETDTPFLTGLLLFASIAVFGMLEIVWRSGQLSHTLLLLLPRFAWQCRLDGASCKTVSIL